MVDLDDKIIGIMTLGAIAITSLITLREKSLYIVSNIVSAIAGVITGYSLAKERKRNE